MLALPRANSQHPGCLACLILLLSSCPYHVHTVCLLLFCAGSIAPGAPKAKELKLNSYFMELGENSMMKEVVAYEVCRQAACL